VFHLQNFRKALPFLHHFAVSFAISSGTLGYFFIFFTIFLFAYYFCGYYFRGDEGVAMFEGATWSSGLWPLSSLT